MKSSFALNFGCAALLASLLAGCGQPGPLFMPKPPKPATPPQPQAQPAIPVVPALPAPSPSVTQ